MSRVHGWWWCGVLVLVLSACRVDAAVDVTVDDEGAGTVEVTVTLDEDAARRLGDPGDLRLEDLDAAGWAVEAPVAGDGGGYTFAASKAFAGPDELSSVMNELTGADGPLRDVRITRETPFASTRWDLEGTLDLSEGVAGFGDAGLAEVLGTPVGWTSAELEDEIGTSLSEAFGLEVMVSLPGSISGNGTRAGDTMVWSVDAGDGPVDLEASGTSDNTVALALAGVAVGALALLGFVIVIGVLRYLRDDRRPAAATAEEAEPRDAHRLELVVLQGAGVLYETDDVATRLLYPFARELGTPLDLEQVRELHHQATLGRRTSEELWRSLAVEGDPRAHDRNLLTRVRLSPDVVPFLERMRERGLRVAVVDNDVAAWSAALRRRFRLDDVVDMFVISAEVGARLPDSSMFEALRRASGVDPARMVFLSTDVTHLDVAAARGMASVWFSPPDGVDTGDLRVVRSFGEFFTRA